MDAIPYAYLLFFGWSSFTSVIILSLVFSIICESLVDLKAEAEEEQMIKDTEVVESHLPLANLILQQADITRSQQDMEMVINSLLLRLPSKPSTNIWSSQRMCLMRWSCIISSTQIGSKLKSIWFLTSVYCRRKHEYCPEDRAAKLTLQMSCTVLVAKCKQGLSYAWCDEFGSHHPLCIYMSF